MNILSRPFRLVASLLILSASACNALAPNAANSDPEPGSAPAIAPSPVAPVAVQSVPAPAVDVSPTPTPVVTPPAPVVHHVTVTGADLYGKTVTITRELSLRDGTWTTSAPITLPSEAEGASVTFAFDADLDPHALAAFTVGSSSKPFESVPGNEKNSFTLKSLGTELTASGEGGLAVHDALRADGHASEPVMIGLRRGPAAPLRESVALGEVPETFQYVSIEGAGANLLYAFRLTNNLPFPFVAAIPSAFHDGLVQRLDSVTPIEDKCTYTAPNVTTYDTLADTFSIREVGSPTVGADGMLPERTLRPGESIVYGIYVTDSRAAEFFTHGTRLSGSRSIYAAVGCDPCGNATPDCSPLHQRVKRAPFDFPYTYSPVILDTRSENPAFRIHYTDGKASEESERLAEVFFRAVRSDAFAPRSVRPVRARAGARFAG